MEEVVGTAGSERDSSGSFWHRLGSVIPKAGREHSNCNSGALLRITVMSALECDRGLGVSSGIK